MWLAQCITRPLGPRYLNYHPYSRGVEDKGNNKHTNSKFKNHLDQTTRNLDYIVSPRSYETTLMITVLD